MIQQGVNQLLTWGALGANYYKEKQKKAADAAANGNEIPNKAEQTAPVQRQPDMRPVQMAMDMFRTRANNALDQKQKFSAYVDDLRKRKAISHSAYEQIKEAVK